MKKRTKTGFVQIPPYCELKDNNISFTEYAILSVIAHFETMKKGYCFLSIKGLAEETNLGITQTKVHLKSLESKGFIVGKHKHRNSTHYNTSFFEAGKPTANETEEPTTDEAGKPTRNNNDINNIEIEPDQYTRKMRVRTRTQKKEREYNITETVIDFDVRNPEYDKNDPYSVPFSEEGIKKLYKAGLKIGYRMNCEELLRFAEIMITGRFIDQGYKKTRRNEYDLSFKYSKEIKNFELLIRQWKDSQTPDMKGRAEIDKESLEKGGTVFARDDRNYFYEISGRLPEIDDDTELKIVKSPYKLYNEIPPNLPK